MKLETLRSELSEGTVRPAYLVAGEEPLQRDDALALLREAVLARGSEDFNFDRLDGEYASPGALLDAVRTLPVLADRRLVVLREPESGRGPSKALTDAVAEAVSDLARTGGSVLVVVAEKVDRRARWVKAFAPPAAEVRCDPPRDTREIMAFVRAEAKRQGVSMERGAAELLVERVGPQLLVLRQEIAKAALRVGKGEKLTRAHVASGTSHVAEEPIWVLTDAIGEGRSADALIACDQLLRAGAAPPQVLAALATHFRKLLRLRTGGSVAGPAFVAKKLKGQARRYTAVRLLACLRAIHDADLALKGAGGLRPEMALERLVMGLSG